MTTGRPSFHQNSGHVRPQRFFSRVPVVVVVGSVPFVEGCKHTKNHGTENYLLPGFCHMWVLFLCCLIEITIIFNIMATFCPNMK